MHSIQRLFLSCIVDLEQIIDCKLRMMLDDIFFRASIGLLLNGTYPTPRYRREDEEVQIVRLIMDIAEVLIVSQ
jgi:hypothetical protein